MINYVLGIKNVIKDFERFLNFEEAEDWLINVVTEHENANVESIGKSFEQRDIWSVSIGQPNHPKPDI